MVIKRFIQESKNRKLRTIKKNDINRNPKTK